MSDWFRGVIEAAYVGTPAKPRAHTPLDVTPYDIKLYRGSISAIERIPAPAADKTTADKSAGDKSAGDKSAAHKTTGEQQLRQAELLDVQFLGVGAEDARDEHAAYDLRLTNVRLLGATEAGDQLYGRLSATVVGCLTPSSPTKHDIAKSQARSAKSKQQFGTWVEGLRWVMIATIAWLGFGLCGSSLGILWLAVVLPAAFLRFITPGLVAPTHGARVFGWAMVLACGILGALMFYRARYLECTSTLWWTIGMGAGVFVTALLPSRYAFFWTKAILAGSVLPLCVLHTTTCKTERSVPSVVSQGPRTDPDGHWPRQPDPAP